MKTILAMSLLTLLAVTAGAATVTPVASGLDAAIGQAYSLRENAIYFVEWNAGEVSRLDLATGAVTTIHTGLVHPEGIALLPGHDLAYVTTRDGKLWKLSTTSGARREVASGLGEPHAIVIDPSSFTAYVTDFAGGHLWQVDLALGGATAVAAGLRNPLGLLLSADFGTAYVSESDRILALDLRRGGAPAVLASGLANAFFMDWADDARAALYFVERDPANRVSRLDLATGRASFIAGVAWRPSSVVRSADPGVVYVASDKFIERVTLTSGGGPVITRLGHIPSTSVDFATGQATTDPAYFFRVKNASFGGTVHIGLNFPGMRGTGAAYYKVLLDGAAPTSPEVASWVNHRWDGSTFRPETVVPSLGFYQVPGAGEVWAIPDLGFTFDSTRLANGRHLLRVKLYDVRRAPLSTPEAEVALLVDNEPPSVSLDRIEHDGVPLDACALITSGTSLLAFTLSAFDPQGHLYSYSLTDSWGRDRARWVAGESYVGTYDSSPTWFGVRRRGVTHDLAETCTKCAHSFALTAVGNTTDGYHYLHHRTTFVHLAAYLPGPCF